MGEERLDRIVVRGFDPSRDGVGVEEVERRCEVGPGGKLSLFTDLLGDPICRVRNSPAFLMLVHTILMITLLPLNITINFLFNSTIYCQIKQLYLPVE